jgi:hypothetical protein
MRIEDFCRAYHEAAPIVSGMSVVARTGRLKAPAPAGASSALWRCGRTRQWGSRARPLWAIDLSERKHMHERGDTNSAIARL